MRNLGSKMTTFKIKTLLRTEPFDRDIRLANPLNSETGEISLRRDEERVLLYRVPYKGWRNQYRVEVWDAEERVLYFRSIWYSLGEPLTYGWRRDKLGILPQP